VLDILGFLRTEYKPGPGEFLQIDRHKLVEKFDLKTRGKERGAQSLPHADSTTFDEYEYDITENIRSYALNEETRAHEQLSHYEQRLQSADPHGAASEMRAIATQAVQQFDAEVLAAQTELERAWSTVAERQAALAQFRARNDLTAPPQPPINGVFGGGLIAVLFLAETLPNAFLLGAGDEQGSLGGWVISGVFSLLNLFFGFAAGRFGWTNARHRNTVRKAGGLALALGLLTAVVFLNAGVAHVRELVSAGIDTNTALQRAWDIPLASWFIFHDTLSMALAGLGIVFSLIVMIDGYKWQDPYPGYAAMARHLKEAETDWTKRLQVRLNLLDGVQKRYADELRAAQARLRDRRAAIPEILAGRARLVRNFRIHLQHLEGVGRYALAAYRDANRAARPATAPAPARFEAVWTLEGVAIADPDTRPSGTDEDWQNAHDALEQSMADLQKGFQKAMAAIKKLSERHNAAVETA